MTSNDDSPWSLETLRIYLETLIRAANESVTQRFEDRDKAVSAAFAAAKEAVAKAELAAEKRLDSVNEFRAQLSDQTATFIPRAEAEQRFVTTNDKISELAARQDRNEGKSTGISTLWGVIVGAIGLVAAVVTIVTVLVATRG
jgi:hypothetical protein